MKIFLDMVPSVSPNDGMEIGCQCHIVQEAIAVKSILSAGQ